MSNTPKKRTAKKATAKKAAPKKETPMEEHQARQESLEARVNREFEERVEEAQAALEDLERSVTQREWLLITIRLDRTREQIAQDGGLRLLALTWVKEKREHGGADWDRLLDMTDDDLAEAHGLPTETPEETLARLEKAAQEPGQEEQLHDQGDSQED